MTITLKQLLSGVAICAILIGAALWLTKEWRARNTIQGRLIGDGATWVGFSKADGVLSTKVLFCQPPQEMLTPDDRVSTIEFKLFDLEPESFQYLGELTSLDTLMITSCKFVDTDMAAVSNWPPTAHLILWNVPISDESIDAIAKIPGLEQVSCKGTLVSAEGRAELESILGQSNVIVR